MESGREAQPRNRLIQRGRVFREEMLNQFARRATAVGMLPGEHPIRDGGEAVDVGPTVHQLPGQGFGGHVLECSDEESGARSEEHTSELQSQSNLVCRLLLEKKKKKLRYVHVIVGPTLLSSESLVLLATHSRYVV